MRVSTAKTATVLMTEDVPVEAELIKLHLRGEPYEITHVETGTAALEVLATQTPEAMLLDLNLPDMDGLRILEEISTRSLPTAVVVLTADGFVDTVVSAMRLGAFDYLVKPYDAARLRTTLCNAIERFRFAANGENYQERHEGGRFCGFIGDSAPMQAVYRTIEAAAPSKATMFITGESGTGKELCAEAIHRLSPRRDRPFVVLNCTAIPQQLMESHIFGHVKGAFTNAVSGREGAAALADGGTLFLDELCEMPLEVQTKLLRFVQTGTFSKVGSNRAETVDVRFVCATNRDPWQEVEAGNFREDLYYRMHVIPIALPPLRARGRDLFAIANSLLRGYARDENKSFSAFAPETEATLAAYEWPGNVRELQNVIRQIVVLNEGEIVTPDMLPPPLQAIERPPDGRLRRPFVEEGGTDSVAGPVHGARAVGTGLVRPLWRVERQAIDQAIEHCGGSITRAANLLDISPSTIYRKRKAWALMDTGKAPAPRAKRPARRSRAVATPELGRGSPRRHGAPRTLN
jgi:DNA-binding NtrC family response regulator